MPNKTQIRQHCLTYLAIREHSQQELLVKLINKGFNKEDCLFVLTELADKDYQSDLRYAESYARARANKGYGVLIIEQYLKQKGITDTIIKQIIPTLNDAEFALLKQTYYKKYRDKPIINLAEKAKRTRFLLQRGFDYALIKQLFKEI
jgi:regulatory protein